MSTQLGIVGYRKSVRGAKSVVTWAGLKHATKGKPYEVAEAGAAAVIIDGNLGEGSILIRGSNDGEHYHLLAGRLRPGALSIDAVPAFLEVEVWGDDKTDLTVSIALDKAG